MGTETLLPFYPCDTSRRVDKKIIPNMGTETGKQHGYSSKTKYDEIKK